MIWQAPFCHFNPCNHAIQKMLYSLLEQARSFFGPLKFKELFAENELVELDQMPAKSRWFNPSLPRYDMSETGFRVLSMRVRLMKLTRTRRGERRGYFKNEFESHPFSVSPSTIQDDKEEINTDIINLILRILLSTSLSTWCTAQSSMEAQRAPSIRPAWRLSEKCTAT